jgi:hypothetical protein
MIFYCDVRLVACMTPPAAAPSATSAAVAMYATRTGRQTLNINTTVYRERHHQLHEYMNAQTSENPQNNCSLLSYSTRHEQIIHHASRRRSRRRKLSIFQTTHHLPSNSHLANRAMYLALQNRQRQNLSPPHQRIPLHALRIPHPAPANHPVHSQLLEPHAPNRLRKPQPHPLTAQSHKPRCGNITTRYGEVQDREAGE